jgi:hypothetical protein
MNWQPGDDFCIRFSDKSGENRIVQWQTMIEKINAIANEYGLDVLGYGSWESFKKVVQGELKIMQKE